MSRQSILEEALQIVSKDRNADYGDPEDNFKVIANYWMAYLESVGVAVALNTHDVAAMMILMKVSRLATSPQKSDHWVDIAGYSACGGECAERFVVKASKQDSEPVGVVIPNPSSQVAVTRQSVLFDADLYRTTNPTKQTGETE